MQRASQGALYPLASENLLSVSMDEGKLFLSQVSDEDIYMVPASNEHSLYDQIRRINIAQIQRNAVT